MERRHWLLIALIVALMLTTLTALGLLASAREMIHEGLTYSQWYEGAIAGFFGALQVLIGCSGAVILILMLWIYSKRPRDDTDRALPLKTVICGTLALITCGLVLWTVVSHRTLNEAAASGVESLAPYIKTFGLSRSAAQAALEATVIAGIARLKRKPF